MIEPGTRLATYEIVELLASGGMGQVYLAADTRLERRIALKVLPADMASDPERLERFEREAKAVASLNHPNIVTIHSVEESPSPDGGTVHFITMELVEGQTLDKLIAPGGLPIDRFFEIAVPLADAVGAAHQQGITHRDLKPGNVMRSREGRIKVLDFGLAKLAEPFQAQAAAGDEAAATAATVASAGPITEEGKVLGTVAYMSPEQAEGKPVDNRSDIFSLGIMLYEMATGTQPFRGDTKISLMSSIIKDAPVPVTDANRELPNHLGRIIKHCLEKDPERRLQSAQDVRNELVGLKEEIDSGETAAVSAAHSAVQPSAARAPAGQAPGATPSSDSGAAAPPPSGPVPPVMSPPRGTVEPVLSSGEIPLGPPDSGIGSVPARRLTPVVVVLASVVAVAVLFGGWWMIGSDGGGTAGTAATRSGSGVGAATGAEPVADTRPSVAVLYFDNLSGDESLDWLRTGLTELLVTDLSQSPELRVLTTDALYEILDEMDRLDAPVTSAAVVREVAARAAVEHVVVGSFIRAGDTFRLSARLQEAASGEVVAAETVEGIGEDSVFGSVDDLTRRIKNRLAVPVSASPVVDRDLSDVTTTSMDAYRHYTDGVNLISQGLNTDAIPVFERALEIDPEFAMALAKLSVVYGNIFDDDNARLYAGRAIENADRLTQRERFYIEGRYYGEQDETILQSIEAYENALALYPDDSASRNNVALEYAELERFDEAIAHFEEMLRRGTPFLPSYSNTAMAYVRNGDCDRGYELLRDFLRRQPEWHFGFWDMARQLTICGRHDEAIAALETYEESLEAGAPGQPFEEVLRFELDLLADEFDQAAAVIAPMADSVSPLERDVVYPENLALIALYRGRGAGLFDRRLQIAASLPDDAGEKGAVWIGIAADRLAIGAPEAALEALEEARAASRRVEDQAHVAALTAIAQARAGRTVAARTAAQQHERLSAQLPAPTNRRRELVVAAELALAQDDAATAIERLREAVDLLPPGRTFPFADEYVPVRYALARAYLRDGNDVDAARLFREITEADIRRVRFPTEYVRSFYFLATIAENDGDAAAARRNFRRFLDYWSDGDIDAERVREARSFVDGA